MATFDRNGRRCVVSVLIAVLLLGVPRATAEDAPDDPQPEPAPKVEAGPVTSVPFAKASFNTSQTQKALLRRQYESLRDDPEAPAEWREMMRLERELREKLRQEARKYNPDRARINELDRNPALAPWKEKVEAAEKAYQDFMRQKVSQAAAEARKMFEARHVGLAQWVPAATGAAQALGFDVLNFPRIDGSTSTQPLTVLAACHCLGARYGWTPMREYEHWGRAIRHDDVRYQVGMEWEPEFKLAEYTIQATTDEPAQERKAIIINKLLATNSSTHQSYVNLIEGRSALGLLARRPSADELALAGTKNVELDIRPVALDAFVFLVNRENKVRDLTHEQIRRIYTRKITRWDEVGGAEMPITAFQRDRNSGSQELMRELVMKDLVFAANEGDPATPNLVLPSMGGPFIALTITPGGLGYSIHYYEQFMAASALTCSIAVNGIVPTYQTIRERTYPFTTEVHVVIRKGLDGASPAVRLRDWLLSEEGQTVVRESGYVPISAAIAPPAPSQK